MPLTPRSRTGIRRPRVAGRPTGGERPPAAEARAAAEARVAEAAPRPANRTDGDRPGAEPARAERRSRAREAGRPPRPSADPGAGDRGSPASAGSPPPVAPVTDVATGIPAADVATGTPVPGAAPGPAASEPADADPPDPGGLRGARLRRHLRPSRLPTATTPRATAAVALVLVLLLGAAGYLGVSWWRTAHSAAAENAALVDVAATTQVSQQLGDAVKKVYSFDYTRLDQNERDARDVITPQFRTDFDTLFAQVRELAPKQQAVSTATVAQSAVKEIDGDHAVVVIFLDQQVTRVAAADGSTQVASAGRLTVTGERVDGRWRIADVAVL